MKNNALSKNQKQLQSEQTRMLIIQAATRLFAQKGFYGTSILDLTQAVGLTKGALYHHFKDKDAVFFAVVDSVRSIWDQALGPEETPKRSALDQIGFLFEKHAKILSENKFICLVMSNLMGEMESVNPEYALILENIYDDLILYIEEIVQKGQNNGEIRSDMSPRLIALNIVGVFKSIGCYPQLKHIAVDREAMTNIMKNIVLDGLQP